MNRLKKIVAIIVEWISAICFNKLDLDYNWAREILTSYSDKPHGSCVAENETKIEYDLQIIIPAYNVEEYIQKCLESVRSLLQCKYSVLIQIIDDGSTDSTSEIVDIFSDVSDDNIVVIHQNNKGLSNARNAALQTLRGKYIMFLDADDYLPDSFDLDRLLEYAENCDILQGDWVNVNSYYKIIGQHKATSLSGYAWGKMFNYTVFKNLKFPEDYWFEDTIVRLIISGKSLSIKTIDECVYCYRQNKNGITAKAKNSYKIIDTYWVTELCMNELPAFGVAYDQSTYGRFLWQSVVNQIRIRKQPRIIRKAVFILTAEIVEKLFYDVPLKSIQYQKIEKAIKSGEFSKFELLAISNWCKKIDNNQ